MAAKFQSNPLPELVQNMCNDCSAISFGMEIFYIPDGVMLAVVPLQLKEKPGGYVEPGAFVLQ